MQVHVMKSEINANSQMCKPYKLNQRLVYARYMSCAYITIWQYQWFVVGISYFFMIHLLFENNQDPMKKAMNKIGMMADKSPSILITT